MAGVCQLPIKVTVTEEHIKQGRTVLYCPIELAVRDVGIKNVTVSGKGIVRFYFNNLPPIMGFSSPETEKFVKNYDSDLRVEPFMFYM